MLLKLFNFSSEKLKGAFALGYKLLINLILIHVYLSLVILIAYYNIRFDAVDYDCTPNYTKPPIHLIDCLEALALISLLAFSYVALVSLLKIEVKESFLFFNCLGFIYFFIAPFIDILFLLSEYSQRGLAILAYDSAVCIICGLCIWTLMYYRDHHLTFYQKYLKKNIKANP